MSKIIVGEQALAILEDERLEIESNRNLAGEVKGNGQESLGQRISGFERLANLATPLSVRLDDSMLTDVGQDNKMFHIGKGDRRSTSFEKRFRMKSTMNGAFGGISLKPVLRVNYRELLQQSLKDNKPKTKYGTKKITEIRQSSNDKSQTISRRRHLDEHIHTNDDKLKDPNYIVSLYEDMSKLKQVQSRVKNLNFSLDMQKYLLVDKLEKHHIKIKRKNQLSSIAINKAWRDTYRIEPLTEEKELNMIHEGAQQAADAFQAIVRLNNSIYSDHKCKIYGFEKDMINLNKSTGTNGHTSLLHIQTIRHPKSRYQRSMSNSLVYNEALEGCSISPLAIRRDKSLEIRYNKAEVGIVF